MHIHGKHSSLLNSYQIAACHAPFPARNLSLQALPSGTAVVKPAHTSTVKIVLALLTTHQVIFASSSRQNVENLGRDCPNGRRVVSTYTPFPPRRPTAQYIPWASIRLQASTPRAQSCTAVAAEPMHTIEVATSHVSILFHGRNAASERNKRRAV
jgi:hypothetical protein